MADKIKVSYYVDKSLVKKLAFDSAKSVEEYDELMELIDKAGDEVVGYESDENMKNMAEKCFAHIAVDGVIAANPDCMVAKRHEEERKNPNILSLIKEFMQKANEEE